MTNKLIALILLTSIFSLGCSTFSKLLNVDAMAERLRLQLKKGEFGKIYDEASEHMHRNVTREKFIERASKIAEEMERVDKDLNWQGDDTLGKTNDVKKFEKNTYYFAYKKLGEDTQMVTIFITWEEEPNGKPKLFNLSAGSHPDAERRFYFITAGEFTESK